MTNGTYEGDAILLAGEDLRLYVQADLVTYGRKADHKWGGILREVETARVYDIANSEDLRLRMPDGQERKMFVEPTYHDYEAEFTALRMEGLGTPPF
ncbi:hypothetical protein J7E96_24315 [Streptomyces sp. ISL-96]|uniref:hypothetical protein n=1 Tax=Streptomyces sp. ISL-96 TaxID=2819191 RepID=UPI001BE84A23|nr:hypothetical protein [Streptomyces sp. ISL-96]MBT2491595.1 hypothetical protein [Streptomyces sp. ISL-96]